MALADPRGGTIYAALKLGHFGPKLRRSHNGGKTRQECAAMAFPPPTQNDKQSAPFELPRKILFTEVEADLYSA